MADCRAHLPHHACHRILNGDEDPTAHCRPHMVLARVQQAQQGGRQQPGRPLRMAAAQGCYVRQASNQQLAIRLLISGTIW